MTYSNLEMMIFRPHVDGERRWTWGVFKNDNGAFTKLAGGYAEDQEDAFLRARRAREYVVNRETLNDKAL